MQNKTKLKLESLLVLVLMRPSLDWKRLHCPLCFGLLRSLCDESLAPILAQPIDRYTAKPDDELIEPCGSRDSCVLNGI